MTNQANNYVKDIENKSQLDSSIQSVEGIDLFDFNKFDKEIEKSFQSFIESNKNQLTGQATKDTTQTLFNAWLNQNYDSLDKMKDTEIDNKIVQKTTFELQSFQTITELGIFQQQMQIEKDRTETREIVTLGETEITINFYNGITSSEVIHEINGQNFEGRQDVINLLKEGKIKELQKKIGGKKNSNKYEKLPRYGDDGKFGRETFDALKKYIETNNITTPFTEASAQTSSAAQGIEEVGGSAVPSETQNLAGNIESSIDSLIRDHHNCDLRETIDLFTNIELNPDFEIIPPDSEKNVKIKDKTLQYTGNFSGQETFSIKIKVGEQTIKKTITVDINGEESRGVDGDGFEEFRRTLRGNVDTDINLIGDEIKKLKEEYNKEGIDNKRKLQIENLIDKLSVEQAKLYLKKQFNHVASGNDRSGGTKDSLLREKLINDCTINIGGQDIEATEFLQMLEKGRLGNFHIIDLQLQLNSDYLNESSSIRNYTITRLVISDDVNFARNKNITKDQEIQYQANAYVETEKGKESRNDRQAIRNILGIRGIFGMGGVNENMSIATQDYNTNNPVFRERRDLKKLKNILLACLRDKGEGQVDIRTAFEKIADEYSTNPNVNWERVDWTTVGSLDKNGLFKRSDEKQLQALGELYTKYMKKDGGDYFQKAMGLLDNYFVKGIKTDEFEYDDFEDSNKGLYQSIYSQENIGRMSGLIDPDKSKHAIKSIFKEGYRRGNINLGDVSFQDSKELKELEKITKKVDLIDFFQRVSTVAVNSTPNLKDRHEERLYSQYQKYQESVRDNNKDGNDNFVVLEDDKDGSEYYNAVFHFLVGMGEGRQDIVESVNSLKIMENLNVEYNNLDETWYGSPEEKQFVMLLSDLNFDGRADFGDRGIRMGLVIKNLYKSAKVDQKYGLAPEGEVWQNILDFAKNYSKKLGNQNLYGDLENVEDISGLMKKFKSNPGLLKFLQGMLVNSPLPVEYIFKHGSAATEHYLMPQIMSDNVEIKGLEELFQKEYNNLLKQGLKDSPELRSVLKPMVYGSLIEHGGVLYGGGGAGLSLDTEKAGTFSLNLGYSDVPGVGESGGNGGLLGIMMSWGDTYDIGQKTKLNVGLSGGSALNQSLFIPIASGSVGIQRMMNQGSLDANLKPKSATYIGVGANVTMISIIPTWGLSAGISRDKMVGIDRQYNTIKEKLSGTGGILYDLLTKINLSDDKNDVIWAIQSRIDKKFTNVSADESRQAAMNIYRGLSYYSMNMDGVLEKNDPRLTRIIQDMTENYALQWKNEAMRGSDSLHLESVGVGVQFLAGFVPIPMISATVARYKNLHSTETEQSIANYYAELSTGRGMEYVNNNEFYDDNGMINQRAVDYLNAKMSIAHPNIDTPDLNILISKAKAENSESFDESSKQSLYIPKNLYRYVNINISSDMRNYINTVSGDGTIGLQGVEYIEVPINTKIALMDYSRTNTGRFNLIIGDNKSQLDDIQVNPSIRNISGRPDQFEGQETFNVEKSDVDNVLDSVRKNESFPIVECKEVAEGLIKFALKDDKDYKIMGGDKSKLKLNDGVLSVPQFGTLTIYEDANGNCKFYYSSNSRESIKINYKINGPVSDRQERTETMISRDYETSIVDFSTINIFQENRELDKIFNTIEKDLSTMDDRHHGAYADFMNAAAVEGVESVLEDDNYNNAFAKLKVILNRNNSFAQDEKFAALKNKISDENVSMKDKVMIVDRFKAIFSYHIDLTNGSNDGVVLRRLVSSRRDVYKNLKGYDRQSNLPQFVNDYRNNIVDSLGSKDELSNTQQNNLFGMTAFYRLGNSHQGRGYSMTQMGSTNVLDGRMENILEKDLTKTQNWFLNNLGKSGPHKQILKETLQTQIGNDVEMDDEKLMGLLRGETIDIDNKKVTITLDYVFYLLAECANESIGINLKSIKVESRKQDIEDGSDQQQTSITESEDGSVSIEILSKRRTAGMYVNTVESRSEDGWARKQSLGAAAIVGSIPKNPNNPWSKPGDNVSRSTSTPRDDNPNLGESGGSGSI